MILRLYCFLADHVFRLRYENPMSDGGPLGSTYDIDIAERSMDKMLRDAFLIGGITGVILCIILNLIERAF